MQVIILETVMLNKNQKQQLLKHYGMCYENY